MHPILRSAKLEKGTFIGPQIREVLRYIEFGNLTLKEHRAWEVIKSVSHVFFFGSAQELKCIKKLLHSRENME